ncbi:MAG: sensor histidine kinase [Hyphomicrobiaceae bacterium]|nr:sensor histidine kinase [Hyphomicrobiaceae bacterium]
MQNTPSDRGDDQRHPRLSEFIRHNHLPIVNEWTAFARTLTPASEAMSKLALEDHIVDILDFIADDLDTAQTRMEQFQKSRGNGPDESPMAQSAAEIHAALRLADGFDIDQMVSEYRALRASVVKQWVTSNRTLAGTDIEDLTRFNEAVDQAVTESVAHYTKTINDSRNIFLGVLAHDLRNPIGAATMAAQMMMRSSKDDAKQSKVASEIVRTTNRATQILDDLLDLARSSFGTELRVVRERIDLAPLCQQLADELRAISSGREVEVEAKGDTSGLWDKSRMGQVLSNLMANAIQHGDANSVVSAKLDGSDPDVCKVVVHNHGRAISSDKLKTIFHSWMQGQVIQDLTGSGTHLGLGLYISKLIVEAHGGAITVTSDEQLGTQFIVSMPRS